MNEVDFDLIRPYSFDEIKEAIPRILSDESFHMMMDYLFESDEKHKVISDIKNASNIHEFQIALTLPAVTSIIEKSTDGITHSGFDKIDKEKSYTYLANHRDIVLDSSILGLILLKLGFTTPRITWGSNLMATPLIVDLGKSNQMITVFREGSPKELLMNSQRLSSYIRKSVIENNKPVWIAHRKGRSKDGMDKTDVSILKMLSLSGNSNLKGKLMELNITPVTISYEWEPCDAMKIREIYLSLDQEYVKSENEDFKSIINGLTGQKGRVHISMGKPINEQIESLSNEGINNNEFINNISELVDAQLYSNYKLWPSNYLAFDLLNSSNNYSDKYDATTVEIFEKRYSNTLDIIGDSNNKIRELFLLLYANPVKNSLKNT